MGVLIAKVKTQDTPVDAPVESFQDVGSIPTASTEKGLLLSRPFSFQLAQAAIVSSITSGKLDAIASTPIAISFFARSLLSTVHVPTDRKRSWQ